MNIYIFGFDQAYVSSIVGIIDIFERANQLLYEQPKIEADKKLVVRLVSVDGKPILCQNNLLINVHCGLADIREADIFIITSIYDVDATLPKYRFMIDWLKKQHKKGCTLISVCTGAFLLAETGLLDGKEATTHWAISDLFEQRYPAINLKPEKIVINQGSLYCSAGASSNTDLAYYLLEKHLGHNIATQTAKFFVHDFRRVSQSVYTIYSSKKHNDTQISKAQDWIHTHLSNSINIRSWLKLPV